MAEIETEGFVKQREELERLLTSDPTMEKQIQKLIRKVLMEARREISKDLRSGDAMKSDPRQAYKAVKTAVYRQILGGNVSILRKRGAAKFSAYEPIRKLKQGQRGGNRRARSDRSQDIMSYAGPDRGFILRFLNAGTMERGIRFVYDEHRGSVHRGSCGGDANKYGKTTNTGRRGRIKARDFFGPASQKAMEQASEHLTQLIDELIKQEMK